MSDFATPWLDPAIAAQQRASVDKWIIQPVEHWPPHFRSFADAVRATKCPGTIIEFGCGVGHGKEILDRAGVAHSRYEGLDISPSSIALARERYPESTWIDWDALSFPFDGPMADTIVDGSCLLHIEAWREYLVKLCSASRRWLILHRLPLTSKGETRREDTSGYGQTFPAWKFHLQDVVDELAKHGFEPADKPRAADGDSWTLTFAKPRHWISYCDSAYLPKMKALHASLARHAGPFKLHVLAWDAGVREWGEKAESVEVMDVETFLGVRPELRLENLPGPQRSCAEHMWSVGPAYMHAVLLTTGEPCTYVDADLFAFSSPEPMFAHIADAPAAFVGHNFARLRDITPPIPCLESHRDYGLWNVGAVHVADADIASRWADLVRAHCVDLKLMVEITTGPVPIADRRLRYADQGYIEDLAREFPGVVLFTDGDPEYLEYVSHEFPAARIVRNPAMQWGPWGAHAFELDVRDGTPHFGGHPIVFAHMSSYRDDLPHGMTQYTRPEYQLNERQIDVLYRPYAVALAEAKR